MSRNEASYKDFIKNKIKLKEEQGFSNIQISDINPILKDHQKAIVRWAVRQGRAAIFASFGLGKTIIQLETVRITRNYAGGYGLIVCPLGVRGEFINDAKLLSVKVKFIRSVEEVEDEETIYLTNYETIRDGKIDPNFFTVASLDEASVLRGFGGTKTFREFMALFAGDRKTMNLRTIREAVPYRFVATATPSPNDYIELLAYSAFLGVMDVSQAKTRFFKRDSTKADKLTLHSHKEDEFWLWVSSWGLFVQKPSDLGFSDDGYSLPDMKINWVELANEENDFDYEQNGQAIMFRDSSTSLIEASREKRDSAPKRIKAAQEIIKTYTDNEQIVIWADLNYEQEETEKALKEIDCNYISLYGNQTIDEREKQLNSWKAKEKRVFLSKPMMYGSGVNLQQSNKMIFLGIGFKFNDFIQAIHRIYRFLQSKEVEINIIYTEAENGVRKILEEKWMKHNKTVEKMTEIIKKYGLSNKEMFEVLERKIGVERIESSSKLYTLVHNDTVEETKNMQENSMDMILTSIPFSSQYEYSPNYCDFGHSDTNSHFFEQMDFLSPELLRVLKPGRIAAIHVKDRIVPGGLTDLGFQTVYPFHSDCITHYIKHGFAYMGMITVVTDVVRENNQTYRLGWSEVCKDGSKISCGMPEYILLFRKPQTDNTRAYADDPVIKNKSDYSRARWQTDAHGFWRSSGDRLLMPEELEKMESDKIFQTFRDRHLESIYDYEHHVKIGEHLDLKGKLPVSFMLLQPPSWNKDVWTDVARMRTLNMVQKQKGQEQHLCPLQFDIIKRLVNRFTNKGEVIFDPFSGIGSTGYISLKEDRKYRGHELNFGYWVDSCSYLKSAEDEKLLPSLLDFMGVA